MASRSQQLSIITRISIESLYLAGSLLGALAILFFVAGENTTDAIVGSGLAGIALIIQIVSHRSLSTSNPRPYYFMGVITFGLSGLLLLVVSLYLGIYCFIFFISSIVLAIGLYRGVTIIQTLWQAISVLAFFLALVVFIYKIKVTHNGCMYIPFLYLFISIFIAVRRHWTKSEIEKLWDRGRLFEIFGLPDDATRLEITKRYNQLLEQYKGHKKIESILREAFEILNVNERNQLYRRSQAVMMEIRKRKGEPRFRRKEAEVWKKLWSEVEARFPLSPELFTPEVHRELVNKYSQMV